MTLLLCIAESADAARIAEIHMAAFGSNVMLRAQFPNAIVRHELQRTIEKKALADIQDPKTTVFVVRDFGQTSMDFEEQNAGYEMGRHPYHREGEMRTDSKVIGFAKWSHPLSEDEDYVEPLWVWPEGTNWEGLDLWNKKMEEVQERLLRGTPCYRKFYHSIWDRNNAFRLFIRCVRMASWHYHAHFQWSFQSLTKARSQLHWHRSSL